MQYDMNIAERLRAARKDAGFRSAAEAANQHGWTPPTYAAHENGTRGIKIEDIEKYAKAFRTDPCGIAFGVETRSQKIAGVREPILKEVIKFVLQHDGAKSTSPEEVAELVIDLCHYVNQSGEGGLGQIVDFEMHRRAAQGR